MQTARAAWMLAAGMMVTVVAHAGSDFLEADRDQDGRIDREEAQRVGLEGFERHDTDQDGFLSRAEYKIAESGDRLGVGGSPD